MGDEIKRIGYSDKAGDIDLLGNDRYISGLAEFILHCETPMTISVQGDWGSGKTTALKMLENVISVHTDVHVVWFQTWQYSVVDGGSGLTMALLYHLYDQLDMLDDDKDRKKERRKSILKAIPRIFRGLMESHVGGTFSEMLERAMKMVVLGEEDYESAYKQISELKGRIQSDINELIKTEDGRLVVFIDDLDRLDPVAAVELLERLKIFLDCEKCVYVLAIDPNIVYQGVTQKYGEAIGDSRAQRFFDKIIQVPFYLPVNHYDLRKYISGFLQEEDDAQCDRFMHITELLAGQNPRSIKRAFNRYRLYQRIYDDIVEDSEELLLYYVLLLEQMEPELYAKLVSASVSGIEVLDQVFQSEDFVPHARVLGLGADGSAEKLEHMSLLLENIQ